MNIGENTDFKNYLDKEIDTYFTFKSVNEQDISQKCHS